MTHDRDGDARPAEARLRALVHRRVLDAELASLLWLLVEARIPVLVAGPPIPARDAVRAALLDLLPTDARPIVLAGADEEFEWMPEATELGWRRERAPAGDAGARPRASAATAVLVTDFDDGPAGTWGARARVAIRALALGYGMLATTTGDGLETVLRRLTAPPVAAADDELSRIGVVLALGETPSGLRVLAAHYLRPVARDEHGHVQRLPPAVLATWDAAADRFEHFAWGIAGELASRSGRRAIEHEREQARRAGRLGDGIRAS